MILCLQATICGEMLFVIIDNYLRFQASNPRILGLLSLDNLSSEIPDKDILKLGLTRGAMRNTRNKDWNHLCQVP